MKKTSRLMLLFSFIVLSLFLIVPNVDWLGSGTEAAINKSQSHKKSKKIKSERKKRMKGEYAPDQPDMFIKLHREIRTGAGQSEPSYKPNYKFEEFEKSKKNISPLRKSSASITWQERGPGNVGGRTRGIVVDVADATKQTWFAAAVSGGIWKTTNAGTDWEEKTFTLPNLATTCIVQSLSNPDVMYAGTGEGFYNVDAISGDGVFKSTDHGETWIQLSSTAGNKSFNNINRIVVNPDDENVVVLCANGSGIQKSVNGGQTWTSVLTGTSRVQQIIANPNSFDTLYAAINGTGVYKSTDGGSTWLNSSAGLKIYGRVEIAISKSNPDYLYASIDNSTSELFISTDAGANWKLVSASATSFAWLGEQGWYDNTLQVHPYNEKIVYVGGIDLYRLLITDELTSAPKYSGKQISYWFTSPNSNYVHADQHNIQMIETGPTSYRILIGNDGGVFYSDNEGGSWTEVNNGYNTTQFYGCDKKQGAEEFIGGMQDNGTWQSPIGQVSTASSTYSDRLGGDGYLGNFKYNDGSKILGAIYNDDIYKSTDNGENWLSAIQGLTDAAEGDAPFITVIAKTNSDPDLLFTTGGSGVWRSDNFADNWTLSEMDQTAWGYSYHQTPVEISLADPQIVWAGAKIENSKKIQVSTDGGITFSATNNYASLGAVTNIASHPTDKNTAFVLLSIAGKAKILQTTDLGQSWIDISQFATGTSANGFPDVAVYDLIVMPYDTNIYWAFTEIGIFESVDAGANWNYLNDPGFPAVAVWRADIVDDMIVMATHGRGIWTAQLNELQNYAPPTVVLSPVLSPLGQKNAEIVIPVKFRSVYDSTNIYVNDEKIMSFLVNEIKDEIFNFAYTSSGVMNVSVSSYKNGIEYKSSKRSIEVMHFSQPIYFYSSDLNNPTDDFILNGMEIISYSGFDSPAIHSPHFYSDMTEYTAMLTAPIIVSESNSFFRYKDIAIVEPGDDGITNYNQFGFWDYVVVEATTDGVNWIPLGENGTGNGYDARFNTKWLEAYNDNNLTVDNSYYVQHEIDLSDFFSAGDQILIRFRLSADAAANSWGWAIDDIELQAYVGIKEHDSQPAEFNLSQNYPNPFNPSTTINFSLPRKENVELKIYDAVGREVETLVDSEMGAGTHQVKWNAAGHASGIYFYKIKAGSFTQSKKLMLLK